MPPAGTECSLVQWSVTCFATNDAPLSISRLPLPQRRLCRRWGRGRRRGDKRPCSNDRKHPPGKPVAFIGLLQTVSRTYNRTPRPTVVVSLPLPFPARSWNNSGSRSDAPHSRLKDRAMREPPPAQLTALLKQLGLATDRDFEGVEANVHRMAGDLPRFESVWIDALRQARVLTQFQAAEFHAGRGEALKVARYVLCQSVQECGYAAVYRAEDRQTREIVRLAVCSSTANHPHPDHDHGYMVPDMAPALSHPAGYGRRERGETPAQLEELAAAGRALPRLPGLIEAAGLDGQRLWAASPWIEGTSLADLVLHHRRFPPEVVLEIARAMLGELVALEAAGMVRSGIGFQPVSVHGDICVQNVLVTKDGEVHIPHPGLRGVIRPQEGISHHDLAPEACSTLAPERVTEGTPPTVASDLWACGCVWWHILCGRPPLGGGDTLARLRSPGGCGRGPAPVGGRCSGGAGRGHWRLFAEGPATAAQVDGRPGPAARSAAAPRSSGNRPLFARRGTPPRALAAIEAKSREEGCASASVHGGRPGGPGRRGGGLADLGCTQWEQGAGSRRGARAAGRGAGGAPAQRVGEPGAGSNGTHRDCGGHVAARTSWYSSRSA